MGISNEACKLVRLGIREASLRKRNYDMSCRQSNIQSGRVSGRAFWVGGPHTKTLRLMSLGRGVN